MPTTSSTAESHPDIEELHNAACAAKKSFYIDPATKFCVFTAYHLSSRKCCGCGCRHCPYRPRTGGHQPPRMLHAALDDIGESVDVLFWSGGKDSYLALQSLRKESVREVVLLTTYDYNTSAVAHQEVRIKDVVGQAKRLSIPLIGVPVGHGEYVQLVRDALDKLRNNGIVIERVAFGDLHLRHIREWREKELAILGADLYYPLWNIPYEALLKELETANVTVRVSALDKENELLQGARVGDTFNRSFLMSLPPGIDKFGENGEFHTFVDVC